MRRLWVSAAGQGLGADFWTFWCGQTVSNVGTSFTTFVLPLIIYKITGSALDLALATAVTFLPYLLFGLIIGAWIDRTDRKRSMIIIDFARATIAAALALLAMSGLLSVAVIAFNASQIAAIPSLAKQDDLLKANGLVQASYSVAMIIGPALAGVLVSTISAPALLLSDGLSFFISVLSLILIKTSFNAEGRRRATNLSTDISKGVRYVIRHPVLRPLSIMTALLIFLISNVNAQLILYAKQHLQASDTQVGLLYSASGVGYIIFSVAASPLRKRWSFATVVLYAALLKGLLIMALGLTSWFWAACVLWSLSEGMTMLFNISAISLRQSIVPNHLLGRVISISQMLSWSAIPLGTFIGGLVVERTRNISLFYVSIGVLQFLVTFLFFAPLKRAEQLPLQQEMQA
jgi:MFS family permease